MTHELRLLILPDYRTLASRQRPTRKTSHEVVVLVESCTDGLCAGNTESWFEIVLLSSTLTVYLCWVWSICRPFRPEQIKPATPQPEN